MKREVDEMTNSFRAFVVADPARSLQISANKRSNIVFLSGNLIVCLQKIFNSIAMFGRCYYNRLLDNIIGDREVTKSSELLNTNWESKCLSRFLSKIIQILHLHLPTDDVEYLINQIRHLKIMSKIGVDHVTFEQFKQILLREANLSSADFANNTNEKLKRSRERMQYSEMLKKVGAYDDGELVRAAPLPSKFDTARYRAQVRLAESSFPSRPDEETILRGVALKMKEGWEEDRRWDEEEAAADENKDDGGAVMQKLINERLEPLTPAEHDAVAEALAPPQSEAVLIEKFNAPITVG